MCYIYCMDKVESIFNYLLTSDKTLVFSSETAARNAASSFIDKYPGKALFKDRTISWDTFLLSLLERGNRKNVRKTQRKAFAYSFLLNGGLERMEYFASPLYRESTLSYASSIQSLLPFLPPPGDEIRSFMSQKMLHDSDILRSAYSEYLDGNNLYEKNYLTPDFSKIEKEKFVFVFPETFTSSWAKKITDLNLVEVISSPNGCDVPFIEYENSISEIRSVLRKIEKDRLTHPDYEIALTSSSLDTYKPYLISEAAKRDIPLVFTSSEKLSSYNEGRLMRNLYDTYNSNWSFEEVKALLLDPAFPFKDRDTYIRIIRKAIDRKMADRGLWSWERILDDEEKTLFTALSKNISDIVKSTKPSLTLIHIKAFRDRFFTPGEWDEESNRVFGSVLELLDDIPDENTPGLFRLFISLIEETDYVENRDDEDGIRVYQYPASVGLIIPVHYVTGLDDRTTEKKIDDYPFLVSLSRPEAEDLKEPILSAYSSSLFTEKTVLSGSVSGFDGARLLPEMFLDRVEKEKERFEDSYDEEKRLWTEGEKPVTKPYISQKKSYDAALSTSLIGRDGNVIVKPFIDESISLSVSKIKDYDSCPYRGYASSRLKIEDRDYAINKEDPLVIGEILHSSIEKALEEFKTINNIDIESLKDIFIKELEDAKREKRVNSNYAYCHIKGTFIDKLENIKFSNKASVYSSLSLLENEKKISGYPLTGKMTINGRVDTILTTEDGGAYIIDWKTGGRNDYSDNLDEMSLQVILYSIILENESLLIKGGAFYSFRDGDYRIIWPEESYLTKSGREYSEGFSENDVKENAHKRLERIRKLLKEGRFTPLYTSRSCTLCPYPRLCREKFSIKTEKRDD